MRKHRKEEFRKMLRQQEEARQELAEAIDVERMLAEMQGKDILDLALTAEYLRYGIVDTPVVGDFPLLKSCIADTPAVCREYGL